MAHHKMVMYGEYDEDSSQSVITIEPNGKTMDEAVCENEQIILELGELKVDEIGQEDYFERMSVALTTEDALRIIRTLTSMVEYSMAARRKVAN